MDQPWRTIMSRWGDALWRAALLRTGDRAAAQRALVAAFEQVFTVATPPNDGHAALLRALAAPRRRWVPRPQRARALPRALRRVEGTTRVLLFGWLVDEQDGTRLASVANSTPAAVAERIASALLPFVARRDVARRTPQGRALWDQWVAQQLGVGTLPTPDAPADDQIAAWQQALDRARGDLIAAVGRQRLPSVVRDAIELALEARDDDTPGWQRRAGWLAAALVIAAVVWVLRPASGTPDGASAAPERTDARTVVQEALQAWGTVPVSGTLHRQVWAVDTRPNARAQAYTTDVWLDGDDDRYRVETTRDGKLIEWQVARDDKLHTLGETFYNMCLWSYGPAILPRRAITFTLEPEQIHAIRDARLRSTTYGEGYRMLRRALRAPDLRSFGVRTEGEQTLVTLGFRDEQIADGRTVLLLLDARTRELQAVRDVLNNGGQTTARDLWRLQTQETVPSVPSTLPRSDLETLNVREVFDPACPGLMRNNLVSMRRLAISSSGLYIPTPLPAQVTEAAIVSNQPLDGSSFYGIDPSILQVVLRTDDGWLRIRSTGGYAAESVAPNMERRGDWNVLFKRTNNVNASVEASLWRVMDGNASDLYSGQMLEIDALNWTRNEVLAVIDQLQPLERETWTVAADRFLDPSPLPADVERVLRATDEAQRLPADGTVHVVLESRTRVDPNRVGRADPYAVPLAVAAPEAFTMEQWATTGNDELLQFKQLTTAPDGTLLAANLANEQESTEYTAARRTAQTIVQSTPEMQQYVGYGANMFGFSIEQALFSYDAPITLTVDGAQWRLEQELPTDAQNLGVVHSRFGYSILRGDVSGSVWTDDLLRGTLVQRVLIDGERRLPQQWQILHRARNGTETPLRTVTVREWSVLPAAPPPDFWALPPLPNGTVTVRYDPLASGTVEAKIVGEQLDATPPARQLVWPAGSGIEQRNDRPYFRTSTAPNVWEDVSPVDAALLNGDLSQLQSSGLVKSTSYNIPVNNGAQFIEVTQGPRSLLHRVFQQMVIHHGGWDTSFGNASPPSEPIQVTIAGQQYTGWLLRGLPNFSGYAQPTAVALVVEIDDVLVYFQGDEAYVRGVLLEQLPALQWEPATFAGDEVPTPEVVPLPAEG